MSKRTRFLISSVIMIVVGVFLGATNPSLWLALPIVGVTVFFLVPFTMLDREDWHDLREVVSRRERKEP